MDPLSVIGLTGPLAGILDVLTRSLSGLSSIIADNQGAHLNMKLVVSQLALLRSYLNQLLERMRFLPPSLESNAMLLADLHASISTCELLICTLDAEIQQLRGGKERNPDSWHKLLIAFDQTCNERQMQITHQIIALHLLLNAMNW